MNILSLLGQSTPYYDSTYYENNQAVAAGLSPVIILVALVFMVVLHVITALLLSKIFKKAGVEGWKAWVPVYNTWNLLELGGQKGYWAVVMFIPVVGIIGTIFMYIAMYHISLNFSKDGAFVLLAIFLPLVWLAWLALDSSTWKNASASVPSMPQNPGTPPTSVI